MRLMASGIVICLSMVSVINAAPGEEQKGENAPREDCYHMKLSDGSTLSIRAQAETLRQRQTLAVWMVRHPPGMVYDKEPVLWGDQLTSIDYAPAVEHYYALVKVVRARIHIFFTWNAQYFVVEKETGQVVKKGKGDDLLKEHLEWIPVKLMILPPSTGGTVETEWQTR
jgi:hypothetical protein